MSIRVVIKLGGRVAGDAVGVVLERHAAGEEVVVVHGAGPQITAELHARGISTGFVRGRRYTDSATLAVVRSSLVAVGAECLPQSAPTPSISSVTRSGSRLFACPSSGSSASQCPRLRRQSSTP